MNQKEISELRRRLTTEKTCIEKIWGCFVNKNKEIITTCELSAAMLPQSELEKYLGIFKKVLSGGLGRNLIDLPFTTQQVLESEKHKLLMNLRDAECRDEEQRKALFSQIIETADFDDKNYLILLAADNYDVPHRAHDGGSHGEDSQSVFRYYLCALCPVSDGKAELGYVADESSFHTFLSPQTVGAPECGFLFPAFDQRQTNIYNALFYTKVTSELHDALIDAVFGTEVPMSADEQKETFGSVLADALEDDLSFDVVQAVHEQIRNKIEEYKESKDPEPMEFDASDVGAILENKGVAPEKVQAFREKCGESFGDGAALIPGNIVDTKKFQIETPEIKISVDPEYSYLIETRIIDGRKYVMIPADEGIEVNGVAVRVTDDKEKTEE